MLIKKPKGREYGAKSNSFCIPVYPTIFTGRPFSHRYFLCIQHRGVRAARLVLTISPPLSSLVTFRYIPRHMLHPTLNSYLTPFRYMMHRLVFQMFTPTLRRWVVFFPSPFPSTSLLPLTRFISIAAE